MAGFPCNQFGAQEPGTPAEIRKFVTENYDIDFPMYAKLEVNGDGESPLYTLLKTARPKDDGDPDIVWNFTKFLVGRDGEVLDRFEPPVTPEEISEELAHHL